MQVQTCRAQTPSRAALAELAQQRSQMRSVAMALDQEADAVQIELNNWPSALSPPDLASMLGKLQGTCHAMQGDIIHA